MTFNRFALIIFLSLFVFVFIKILLFRKERKKIRGKWVESYRYKKDGSIDLMSEDEKLIDNIPNGSRCSSIARVFTFTGHAFEVLFTIENGESKGPFYLKYKTGREIEREFCIFFYDKVIN